MDDVEKIRSLLDEYGFAPGVELGDCMEPSIQKGEKLLVEKADTQDMRVGDVVVFKRGQLLYAHRVFGRIKIRDMFFFITRGDRAENFDCPVSSKIVLGRVVDESKIVQGVSDLIIYALLAVYYVNKKISFRIPLYRFFSGLVDWVI